MSLSLPEMLRRLLLIRTIEERLRSLVRESKAPVTSPTAGQEAAALGVVDALGPEDLLLTNHRSLSHLLSRGADPARLLAEIYGKRTGYCKGKSGFRHVSIRDLGVMLTSTVVGAELSMAPGVALALNMQGSSSIVACFFGDGAACEGVFHEALNLASLWRLPVLFACENNQWQCSVGRNQAVAAPSISGYAAPHGVRGQSVDGMDIEAVREAAQAAVAYVRKERRPFLLESVTYRLRGHNSIDPQSYVDPEELARQWARDPLQSLSKRLAQAGVVTDEARAQMQREVEAEADRAFAFAQESAFPAADELFSDVYA